MEVKLLFSPKHDEALNLIYAACRQCYSKGFIGDVDLSLIAGSKKVELIKKVYDSGHHSTLEHVNFTFAIEGVSRNCTHQLVRHRHISPSQQSQRYCDSSESQIVIPEAFDEEAKNDLLELERLSLNYYKKHKKRGFKNEDLRSFLLSCTKSNLVVTLNIRELIHILELRLCKQAQKEIRLLVTQIHKLCKEILPEIFDYVGPKCQQLGYCNEGERSCGLMPLKEDVFWYIEELQFRKRAEKNAPILHEKFKAIFEDMAKEGGDMIE